MPSSINRIALYTDSDVFAGTERHICDLAQGLSKGGLSVTVACPFPAPLAEKAGKAGINVVPIQKQGLVDWAAIRTLSAMLRSGEIDLIHAHNGRTRLAAAAAVRLAGTGRCVATEHFLEPNHTQQGGLKAMPIRLAHHWVNARTHRFIAISNAVRQKMLERHEAPDGRITVVPNGLSCGDQTLNPPTAIRQEFGIPADAPLVVCVARLAPEKDIPTLLTAMQTVLRTYPEARAIIVGDGAQHQSLQENAEKLGIAQAVRFAGFREDALAFIQAADVFVLPSLAEPFGLVLLEAMALGKPVIATNAGGPCEIVVEGETGLLVPPSDPRAMAAALDSLLAQPALRKRLGANGLLRHQKLYSVDVMAANTIAVYENALHNS